MSEKTRHCDLHEIDYLLHQGCYECLIDELATLRGELGVAKTQLEEVKAKYTLRGENFDGVVNGWIQRAEAAKKECEELRKSLHLAVQANAGFSQLNDRLTVERDAAHATGRREAVERCMMLCADVAHEVFEDGFYTAQHKQMAELIQNAIRVEFGGEE